MLIASMIPPVALAQPEDTKDISHCAAIADPASRLDCKIGLVPVFVPPVISPPAVWEDTKLVRTPIGTPHRFPWGQCTFYVASRRLITFGGNAKTWIKHAPNAGYDTGTAPTVGAVVVRREGPYGHVAYVEEVDATSRTFKIAEMNYKGRGVVSTRTLSWDDKKNVGFIL